MKNYNILFITPRLDIGGEELSTIAIAEELKKRGHRVFYMSSGGPLFEELKNKRINYLEGKVNGKNIFGIIRGAFAIGKILRKYQIDIIHGSEPRMAIMGYFATKLIQRKKIKVLWHDRGTMNHALSAKLFNFMADFVITNSRYEKNELVKRGLMSSKVKVVHNSMYLSINANVSPSSVFNNFKIQINNDPIIGITSRLIDRKGHKYFLEAIPYISKYFKNTTYIVVGDGELREELESNVQNLKANANIRFVGYRRDLERIYPFLDILVVPSLYEPLGNVSMEAMAFGKPVVASNTGGIPEVVEDGITGILVPPRDSKKIAEAVIYLLKNPDVAKKMGEAGRRKVQKYFTIDRVGNELEEVYEYVMENKK